MLNTMHRDDGITACVKLSETMKVCIYQIQMTDLVPPDIELDQSVQV
jgi:hypothetical protein